MGAIQVLIEDLYPGIGGKFTCPGERDRIQMDLIDPYEDIRWNKVVGIAAHEMGHALNMKHAGDRDSWDVITTDGSGYEYPNEMPTMGCGPGVSYAAQRTLEQDDWAFLEFNFTSYVNGHANTSFEFANWPKRFWGKSSGTSLSVETTGSSDGIRHVRLGGTWAATMWQTVRISDPADLTGRVNFRQTQSGTVGQIYYGLWGREIEYPDTTECRFRNGWDLSDPDTSGLLVLAVGRWDTPTSSWEWPDTPEWTAVDAWQGVDVRLKITNYVTEDGNPGNPVDVRIDHARVRHT